MFVQQHLFIRYVLILLFAVLTVDTCLAQPDQKPVAVPANLKRFIPEGYDALDLTQGDLNLDPYTDAIFILYKKGEEKTSNVTDHPEKRPLLILLGQADKTYKLAAQSNNTVYCVDCGGMMGDPYNATTIKKGYFSVEHYGGSGWRWTRIVTFKYSPTEKNWFLYKDGGDSFHSLEPEKVKTTIRTVKNFGKITFTRFDIYKE